MGIRLSFGAVAGWVLVCATAGLGLAAGGSSRSLARAPSLLVGTTAAHHPGFDRVVFTFWGSVPSRRNVRYVSRLTADPSGKPVPIAGRAIIETSFYPAAAHTSSGAPTAPASSAFPLPNVMKVLRSGDFESVLSFGIGLAARASLHMHTLANPSRVVIDVGVPFRTTVKRVYFLNRPHFSIGKGTYFTPVLRPVPVMTPATGLLDRLFAGPTARESRDGLALLRSGATGFSNLSVSGGIARVRLTGACSSGGSTASIADEIDRTLKQLPTVRYVKIYDPSGHTEKPNGLIDSRPACLEP